MHHLTADEVSRLVDEPATEDEAAHLAECEACRADVADAREQRVALGGLPALRAPTGGWESVRRRVYGTGGPFRGGSDGLRAGWRHTLPRLAAGIALFVAGGLTSEIIRGRAGGDPQTLGSSAVATVGQAERALLTAEAEYIRALTRYAELTGEADAADPVARLAALEGIVLTTRAALKEAPADPVINGYHLTALTQREAILTRIEGDARGDDGWY